MFLFLFLFHTLTSHVSYLEIVSSFVQKAQKKNQHTQYFVSFFNPDMAKERAPSSNCAALSTALPSHTNQKSGFTNVPEREPSQRQPCTYTQSSTRVGQNQRSVSRVSCDTIMLPDFHSDTFFKFFHAVTTNLKAPVKFLPPVFTRNSRSGNAPINNYGNLNRDQLLWRLLMCLLKSLILLNSPTISCN